MAENIEETNAKRWEEDTDISSVAPSRLPPGLVPAFVPQGNDLRPMSQIGGARNPYGGNNNPRAPAQQQQSRGRGSGQAAFRGRGSPVPNRSQPSVRDEVRIQVPFRGVASPTPDGRELRADHSGRGRPVYNPAGRGSFQGPGRRQRTSPEKFMLAKSGAWAEPPTLLTTQRQREQEAKELEEKLRDVYLTPPEEGADPYGVAYIIWGESEAVPTDLLGAGLEELSHIRTAYKVWIEWKEQHRAIKISSRSEVSHQKRVQQAVIAVREVLAHAHAKAASFTAIYIAAIPTASGMRSIVLPKIIEDNRVTRLQFSGEPLVDEAKEDWKNLRPSLVRDSKNEFVDQLTQGLLALAPYKGWMRMRVHFGHVEFSLVHNNLKKGKYGFTDFKDMLGNPRTAGRFERKLEGAGIADNVMKRILAWPSRYKPVEGSVDRVEEVNFKNTEIIFVSVGGVGSNGQALRIEADIERIHTRKEDEYQIGTRRLFKDNAINKKLEITTIDVENRVDWAVEVITDNSIERWPDQLTSLIKTSVSTRTKAREDSLGLEYPAVTPTAPWGVYITKTVVRSVIQYKVRESGYIIEIAIYRTWEGEKTSDEPKMESSVSIYHPYWDDEMESIESKATEVRQWDSSLSHFFNYGFAVEGIPALRDEIAVVQGFLSAAQLNADAQANAQQESGQEENSD